MILRDMWRVQGVPALLPQLDGVGGGLTHGLALRACGVGYHPALLPQLIVGTMGTLHVKSGRYIGPRR